MHYFHDPVTDDPVHVEDAAAHEAALLADFKVCGVEPDEGPCLRLAGGGPVEEAGAYVPVRTS